MQLRDRFHSPVRRAIVDNDKLPATEGLLPDRENRLPQIPTRIEDRHTDTDNGRVV